MAENQMSRLGPLFGKLGLKISPEIVKLRLEGAAQAFEKYDSLYLESLVRGAFEISDSDDLSVIAEALRNADATYGPENDDREVSLVACGLLHEKMSQDTNDGKLASLAVSTAGFGGIRKCSLDPNLIDYSEEVLADAQISKNNFPQLPTSKVKPKLNKNWDELEPNVKANQYDEVHAGLKKIVDSSFTYTESVSRHLANQLIAIVDHQRLLDEQMQIYWWSIGSSSIVGKSPFKEMDEHTAVFCAAIDLSLIHI